MRKLLQSSIYLMASIFLFTSCEAWEDESYHPGGDNNGGGGGMLLKEVKTTSSGLEGKATYLYDSSNRVKEVTSYANILDTETYTKTIVTYSSNTNATSVTNMYMGGIVQSTITTTTQVTGSIVNVNTVTEMMGMEVSMSSAMTFSAPCGVSENVINTVMMGMPPIETTITYQYTDANCSYKEFQDGQLASTVTMDDKYSPYTTEQNYAMNIVARNATKYEGADGTIQNVAYTYNENNYPTKAVHTFSGTSTEQNYTEEFTYY